MRKRKNTFTYYIRTNPDDMDQKIPIEVSMGTDTVKLTRADIDIENSRPRTTIGCVDSLCAVRSGGQFSHDALLAITTPSRMIIVTKRDKNKSPTHGVLYGHDDSLIVDLNDTDHSKVKLRAAIAKNPTLTLYPVKSRKGIKNPSGRTAANPAGTHTQAPRNAQTPRRNVIPRGARLRAMKSGLLVLPILAAPKPKQLERGPWVAPRAGRIVVAR